MATCCGDVLWRRVVATCCGDALWRRVVATCRGDVSWRRVGTSDRVEGRGVTSDLAPALGRRRGAPKQIGRSAWLGRRPWRRNACFKNTVFSRAGRPGWPRRRGETLDRETRFLCVKNQYFFMVCKFEVLSYRKTQGILRNVVNIASNGGRPVGSKL